MVKRALKTSSNVKTTTESSTGPDVPDDTPEEKVVKEAKKRLERVLNWEGKFRERFIDDLKFAEGDSDNMYQWPNALIRTRGDERPCLTINKTRQHNLQIINDAKQNKPSVKIKAVGNGATYEAAQVLEACVRHIEYISNAQSAYDVATGFQVKGGIGYLRVVTDYIDDESFDQEIFIRPFKDPLTVLLDPDIKEADGSDAAYALVFDDMPRDEAEKQFPKYKDILSQHPLNANYTDDWTKPDTVRVAEYYRRVQDTSKIYSYTDPLTGQQVQTKADKIEKALLKQVTDDPQTKWREVVDTKIEWFLIIGNEVVERSVWPGKYIPIIRIVGEETIIQGELDRKGHTRSMKDPQRIVNYWFSAGVEQVALQSKTPYIGAMRAFENLETYWDTANVVNHAWLPYNAYDADGHSLPPPQRQQPPVMSQAYIAGMAMASEELRAVSGQFQSEMGMPGNETSGIAIQQRQRQGDNATYHFIDNLAVGIRFLGKIIIDLIPKVYDTQRIIRVMAEDGVESEVQVDPNAQKAYLKQQQKTESEAEQIVFNPQIGRYSVEADVGPAYATRRQEAFNAMLQLSTKNTKFFDIAGDLMMKAADFPMADELAERFQRTIPDEIKGDGPSPEVQQLTQANQQLTQMLQEAAKTVGEMEKDKKIEEWQKTIDSYKAETERMKALQDAMDPHEVATLAAQLLMDSLKTNITDGKPTEAPEPAPDASMQDMGAMPPPDQGQPAMNGAPA